MDYHAWADWYDIVHAIGGEGDVRFYKEQALGHGGPVLEIGAGTGRIAIPMAEAGLDVTGVDLSGPMLDRARAKVMQSGPVRGRLDLVQADMRTLDLGTTFRTVLIPGRTLLLAASSRDQRRTLRRAAAHLQPGGRLLFNVFNPTPELLADDSPEPFLVGEIASPSGGRYRLLAVNRFDRTRQANRGVQIVQELDARGRILRDVHLDVRVRYLHLSELLAMLQAVRLRVVEACGGFDGSPLGPRSDEMVFITEKAV
jgi:SAM-dependent methyltransferase